MNISKYLYLYILTINLCFASGGSVNADTLNENTLLIQMMQKQMSALRSEVRELKRAQQSRIKDNKVEELQLIVEDLTSDLETQQDEIEELEKKSESGLQLNGYIDFKAVDYKTKENLHKDSFDQHHTALFLDYQRKKSKLFVELEWEHTGTTIKQERAWYQYSFESGWKARLGHFFSPTYWNLNHYPTVALSINDPDFTRKFFPRSFTGIMASKKIHQKKSNELTYTGYLGNGFDDDLVLKGRDINSSKAYGQKIQYESLKNNRKKMLSLHYYKDTKSTDLLGRLQSPKNDYQALMLESEFTFNRFGVVASAVKANNQNKTLSTKTKSSSWYIQPYYGLNDKLKVYTRIGELDADDSFVSALDRKQSLYGLNYKPSSDKTLKLEWLNQSYRSNLIEADRQLWSSLSFAF